VTAGEGGDLRSLLDFIKRKEKVEGVQQDLRSVLNSRRKITPVRRL
jgi:hypothetical protein